MRTQTLMLIPLLALGACSEKAPDPRGVGHDETLLSVSATGRSETRPDEARFTVPESLSPFTVIGLLRRIESTNGLTPDSQRELQGQIVHIEEHYFGDARGTTPDLGAIARTWVQRAT